MAAYGRLYDENSTERAERLKAEGRYEEFVTRKLALRKEEHLSTKQAYERAAREFVPADTKLPEAPRPQKVAAVKTQATADAVTDARSGDVVAMERPDYVAIVDWVVMNIDVGMEGGPTEQTGPPPRGALRLWERARINPDDFYKDIMAKLLPTKSELSQEVKFKDDGRDLTDRLHKIGNGAETFIAGVA